ncbi:hypothetical protein AYI70_g11573, partial [Smittium culicis]
LSKWLRKYGFIGVEGDYKRPIIDESKIVQVQDKFSDSGTEERMDDSTTEFVNRLGALLEPDQMKTDIKPEGICSLALDTQTLLDDKKFLIDSVEITKNSESVLSKSLELDSKFNHDQCNAESSSNMVNVKQETNSELDESLNAVLKEITSVIEGYPMDIDGEVKGSDKSNDIETSESSKYGDNTIKEPSEGRLEIVKEVKDGKDKGAYNVEMYCKNCGILMSKDCSNVYLDITTRARMIKAGELGALGKSKQRSKQGGVDAGQEWVNEMLYCSYECQSVFVPVSGLEVATGNYGRYSTMSKVSEVFGIYPHVFSDDENVRAILGEGVGGKESDVANSKKGSRSKNRKRSREVGGTNGGNASSIDEDDDVVIVDDIEELDNDDDCRKSERREVGELAFGDGCEFGRLGMGDVETVGAANDTSGAGKHAQSLKRSKKPSDGDAELGIKGGADVGALTVTGEVSEKSRDGEVVATKFTGIEEPEKKDSTKGGGKEPGIMLLPTHILHILKTNPNNFDFITNMFMGDG